MAETRDVHKPVNFLAGDALRGTACIAILLFHLAAGSAGRYGDASVRFADSYGNFGGGFVLAMQAAVPIFFALSGYLLGGTFLRAWVENKPMPALAKYSERRVRRLLPAFWIVLLFILIRHGASGASNGQIVGMFAFQHTMNATGTFPLLQYMSQLWTVDVEAYFYVAAPLLGFLLVVLSRLGPLARTSENTRRYLAIALLVITGIASLWLRGRTYIESPLGRSLLSWWTAFVPGMFLAVVEVPGRMHLPGTKLGKRLAVAALGVAILGLICRGWIRPESFRFQATADVAGGTFLVVAAMIWQWTSGGTLRIMETRWYRALGRWSYGIYLWHIAVLYELDQIVPAHKYTPKVQILILIVPAIAISVALGALSWRFVEQPIIKRAKKPVPREATVLA